MFLGVYSQKRKLTYKCRPRLPAPYKAGRQCAPFIECGFPVTPRGSCFYECSEYIQRGDEILLYTDGMTECRSKDGEQFGVDGLKKSFGEAEDEPLSDIMDSLENSFNRKS